MPKVAQEHPEPRLHSAPIEPTMPEESLERPFGNILTTTRSATEPQAPSFPRSNSELQEQDKTHKPEGLTKEDVQHLFYGAPQFMLEKGRRGRYFPQTFFPWNNDLEMSDLQDRRYLRHESFALATLHAHLPIPDEVGWTPGKALPLKKEGLETGKRPMFELGIYERPNMLGLEGREPGTVSMRYFLERPVADGIQDGKIKEHGKDVDVEAILTAGPATEAFKLLALSKDNDELNAKVGKHAPAQDRAKLIREGSPAWKSCGVRDISMKTLAERLEMIDGWRDHVVNAGWRVTILDEMKLDDLHAHLFGELLYPPRKMSSDTKQDKAALKVQIEALVKVLTTPGAWLDLSVPEERLRWGKIMHGRTTRYDPSTGTMSLDPERKWLLIQLLLSVELVMRLDAALRLGIAMHAESFELTGEEIHHFNKLRNLKVNWDLVVARRYLVLCRIKKIEKTPHSQPTSPAPPPAHVSPKSSDHHGGFLGGLRHTLGLDDTKAEVHLPDYYDVAILPRQPAVMVEGILRFANNMGWPRANEIQARLTQKLCHAGPEEREKFLMDTISCGAGSGKAHPSHSTPAHATLTPSLESFSVDLHAANPDTVGGWLSHSWLSGLILPGNSTCDILMATLLENDTDPSTLQTLGATDVPFRSCGFILNGSSWWSKSSVIGRVMAPLRGGKESMGWLYLPDFVPLYEATSKPVSNRWVKVKTFPVPTTRQRPRIFDGEKLAMESTPLGLGKGGIMSVEFSMVTDHVLDDEAAPEVQVKDIQVHLSNTNATAMSPDHALSSWAQFDLSVTDPASPDTALSKQVRYGLDRAVYFVTAHPCRLPHGHATFKPGSSDADFVQQHPRHKTAEHLPAHPLHKSYKFTAKTLAEIIHNPHQQPPGSGTALTSEVWLVDARDAPPPPSQNVSEAASALSSGTATSGECAGASDPQIWEKDILVRAWCAEKGRNALVARVGRTCLSCAIREAKALEIGVIIRVGVKQ